MAIDRDGTLKKAEKLLRQDRVDLAIAEYVRVVEDNPRDWSTANTLGELYVRAGQPALAVEQYTRIADHFVEEGFYPKAAALYRKILKLIPDDEATLIRLAEISATQGLLADAKTHLNAVAGRRRARGDRRGTAEIVVRLGSIDPADFEARQLAARTLEEMGDQEQAGRRFKALYDDLLQKGRTGEALAALTEFVRINPLERDARSILAKAALAKGDVGGARQFLDEHSAGEDPELLFPLAEIELRSGEISRARELFDRLMRADPSRRAAVAEIGWALVDDHPDTAFSCIESAVNAAVGAARFDEASATLQQFTGRVPGHVPALLKLVEVCVDGGLELPMYEAQEKLTDAYLAANRAAEARVIAEDLVAREPWEAAHIDRFRKALVMLRVSDPDTLIAERLSGQAPFMARDPFFQAPAPEPAESAAAPVGSGADAPPLGLDPDAEPAAAEEPSLPIDDVAEAPAEPERPQTEVLPPIPVSRMTSDEIDLTGALGALDGSGPQPASKKEAQAHLDRAFARIRDEAGAEGDFSSQHMTLARTYLEIGMLDEAQAALETAVRSPRQRFEAAAALGRLHDRRGDALKAIEWMERAAEAPAPTPEESQRLLYDLGVLLEGAGETSRALAVFLELQSDAGDYGDVPARIDRLARVQTGG